MTYLLYLAIGYLLAIEAERINHLDGILSDRYKEGFHDGLKRALQILANDVKDVEG